MLGVPVSILLRGRARQGTRRVRAVAESTSSAYVVDFLSTTEGFQLNKAFVRIKDPKVRRRVVDLVASAARRAERRPSSGTADRRRSLTNETFDLTLDLPARERQRPAVPRRARRCCRAGDCPCPARIISSPANPSPKAIRTRSATAFPTRSSICSSARRRKPAWTRGSVRVACETLATTNRVVIAGESRGPAQRRPRQDRSAHRARAAIKDIGYEQDGFHWQNAEIEVLLHAQSADIAQGVDAGRQQGRGRRRPGHHVRLCLPRNARADAGADLLRPQDPRGLLAKARKSGEAAPCSAPTRRAR